MNNNTAPSMTTPPRLMNAFTTGFNVVANHVYLILFPVALDLLLLFAPRLHIKTLAAPFLAELGQSLPAGAQPEMAEMLQTAGQMWQSLIGRFNLASTLRSFPVGVPSLIAAEGPLVTPLGQPPVFEVPTLGAALSAWLLFGLIGLTLGSAYFHLLARVSSGKPGGATMGQITWSTMQSVGLFCLMVMIIVMVTLPVFLFLAVMTMFSSALTQFALLLVSIFIIWLLLPLVFSPHGIFAFQLDALRSTLISYRLVRFFLPGTGLFLLMSLLISQGMDILWRVPPEDSWMMLIGIAGHAFISTGLTAASFVYYYGGMRWMQEALQRASAPAPKI